MATLQMTDETLNTANGAQYTVVKVDGGIDATTYPEFEEKMLAVSRTPVKHKIVDMSQCVYINSTGMGLMVRVSDEVKEKGKEIYLVSISEEARHTMEMLGILEFFECFPTVTACIQSFDASRAEQKSPSAPAVGGVFPKRIKCTICKSIVTIASEGKYACPVCGLYLSAEEDGKVKVIRPTKSQSISFSVPAEFEWGGLLNLSVRTLSKKYNFSPKAISDIEPALDEVWSHIAKGKKKEGEICQVVFIGSARGIILGMVIYERRIVDKDSLEGSILLKALGQYADEVQVKALAGDGQIMRLVKYNTPPQGA